MNPKTIIAAILITLGLVVLSYSGFTYTTPGKPVDFLGIHVETTDSHFVPPIAGAFCLVGGLVLLLVSTKKV
jgi:drug/metabolite transporter (DMT)-like permease